MDGNGDSHRAKSKIELLLRASQHFLEKRDLKGCRKYALQATQTDPGKTHFAAAAQILAVCDILAGSETRFNGGKIDWYAVLGLHRYSHNPQLIRENFKRLVSLINPNRNKLPLADEAFGVLREAWSVLSDDSKKTQFDNELKIFESEGKTQNLEERVEGKCGLGEGTFWTMCPYCYYVYEYYRVYENCCMRCRNNNCKKAFQAVPVQSPPPEAVVRNGRYWCLGFRPIGFAGEVGKKVASWTPFSPLSMDHSGNGSDRNIPIEIDEDDDEDNVAGDELNSKYVSTEEVKVDEEGPSMVKPVAKRIKSVARSSKKMMGKGTRVRRSSPFPGYFQELESDACGGEDAVGSGFAQEQGFGSGGVKFSLGDDDIFVGMDEDL